MDAVTSALVEPSTMPLQLQILMVANEDFTNVQPNSAELPLFTDDFIEVKGADLIHLILDFEITHEEPFKPLNAPETTKKSAFSLDLDPSTIVAKPTTASEQIEAIKNRPTVSKRLEKFIENSSGIVDTSGAKALYESVQRAHTSKGAGEVKLDGKVMVKHDKERK